MNTSTLVRSFVFLLLLSFAPALGAEAWEFASPRPGAKFVSPTTSLIFRPWGGADAIESVRVEGAASGIREGEWIDVADEGLVVFRPLEPFAPGEPVTVTVRGELGGMAERTFRFEVSAVAVETELLEESEVADPVRVTQGDDFARPQGDFVLPVDFPAIEVTTSSAATVGSLFLGSAGSGLDVGTPYLLILDQSGFPSFFRDLPDRASDFKVQPNGLLTYFDRRPELRRTMVMDETYTVVDEYRPGNGYGFADFHEFQILPNGHALLMIYDTQIVDMSEIVEGGHPSAQVTGVVIQELDRDHEVVFQWRSWDHFEITDASHLDFTAPRIDYVHANSLALDTDRNILLSSRNLDEVTKIDRRTGEVLWRMGGKNNEFVLVGDTQWFSRQHSARRTATGSLTIFDNGNFNTPQESRVVEYLLDEAQKIAHRVWEHRNDPPLYAPFTGNAQRLENGNTLVSWGNLGIVTEVQRDGTKVFELSFLEEGVRTYRAFVQPWSGVASEPRLWVESEGADIKLHFVKFGDSGVAQYNVYGGQSPAPMQLLGSTEATSFSVEGASAGETWFFRVTAEGAELEETAFSNEVSVTIPLSVSSPVASASAIEGLVLRTGRPNPFAETATISFALGRREAVELSVYDVAGRRVRRLVAGALEAGDHQAHWDGRDEAGRSVSSGVYLVRLRAGDQIRSGTITRLQ